jgi:hypothetical protein
VPFGFSVDLEVAEERNTAIPERDFVRSDPVSGTGYFGAEITPSDNLVLFGSLQDRPRRQAYVLNDGAGMDTALQNFETPSGPRRHLASGATASARATCSCSAAERASAAPTVWVGGNRSILSSRPTSRVLPPTIRSAC